MRKNLFTTLILIIAFVALNLFLPAKSTLESSTPTTPTKESNSSIAPRKSPGVTTEYEDMSTYNLPPNATPETQELLNTPLQFETLDEGLYTELSTVLGDNINMVGVQYNNLSTKEYVSINENRDFDAASTYKVGLNLLYYYLAFNGSINLSDNLTYFDYFYQDGTGVLAGYCYNGMEIPIQELLDLSIIYSDNIATAMLSDYVGGYNSVREQVYTLLNIDYVLYENLLTPKVSAQILKYVYDNKDLPGFNHLVETMKNTVFHDRLDKYIPTNLVAHKIGSIDSCVHDIGIIFTDEPYIISIYTENLYNADEIIASLSKIIYNKHTQNITEFKNNHTSYNKF